MKSLQIKSKCGRMIATFETDDVKTLFEQVATFQEIFDSCECGACHSKEVRFVVREVASNKYYELHCQACKARKSFGVKRDGKGIFPHRKTKNGDWLENGGWTVFRKELATAADDSF